MFHSNFQGIPPLSYLLFIGLVLGTALSVAVVLGLLVTGRRWLAGLFFKTTLAGLAAYFLLLVGSSLASHADILHRKTLFALTR